MARPARDITQISEASFNDEQSGQPTKKDRELLEEILQRVRDLGSVWERTNLANKLNRLYVAKSALDPKLADLVQEYIKAFYETSPSTFSDAGSTASPSTEPPDDDN